MIKSIFTRQGHKTSKAEVAKRDIDPQYYGGRLHEPDYEFRDVYVKLPLSKGFEKLDLASKRRIANALVTPDNYRELFAPDLTNDEWHWLPNQSLETIMKYRWIKNMLRQAYGSSRNNFARVILNEEKRDYDYDDDDAIVMEWLKIIRKFKPEDIHVEFADDPGDAWLHTKVQDLLSPTFDWKTIKCKYQRKADKKARKAAEAKAAAEQAIRNAEEIAAVEMVETAVAEEVAEIADAVALVETTVVAEMDVETPIIIDTGIIALEYRDVGDKRARLDGNDENSDESESKKVKSE